MGITSFNIFSFTCKDSCLWAYYRGSKISTWTPVDLFFKKKKLELLSSLVNSIYLVRRNDLMDLILKSKVSWWSNFPTSIKNLWYFLVFHSLSSRRIKHNSQIISYYNSHTFNIPSAVNVLCLFLTIIAVPLTSLQLQIFENIKLDCGVSLHHGWQSVHVRGPMIHRFHFDTSSTATWLAQANAGLPWCRHSTWLAQTGVALPRLRFSSFH